MTLAGRLNQIIEEQHISKTEFAHRVGITKNYLYIDVYKRQFQGRAGML